MNAARMSLIREDLSRLSTTFKFVKCSFVASLENAVNLLDLQIMIDLCHWCTVLGRILMTRMSESLEEPTKNSVLTKSVLGNIMKRTIKGEVQDSISQTVSQALDATLALQF